MHPEGEKTIPVLMTEEGLIIPDSTPIHKIKAHGYNVNLIKFSECTQVDDLMELLDYLKDPSSVEPRALPDPEEK